MTSVTLNPAGEHDSVATFDGAEWLLECRLLELHGAPCELVTPEASESFLLILAGTHDVYAGGGSWLQRGLRPDPFSGRPLGVFLPPRTKYRLENGEGRALVFSARQPEMPEPESPKEALSKKPLLPMAGSGKAFDPATGTWKPQEAFLSSPEAILPRRIARLDTGNGTFVERILDSDYKALGLCLDEVVLPGTDAENTTIPALSGAHTPSEIAIYYEADGELTIGDEVVNGHGLVSCPAAPSPNLQARGGRAYLAIAQVGPKSAN